MDEVQIRSQHREFVADAKLSEKGIDGGHLHAVPAAVISQFGGLYMIFAIGAQERDCREPIDDEIASRRACETLQEFLKDKTGRQDRFSLRQRLGENQDLRHSGGRIAPEGEGPNARVGEQAHPRSRSDL